jgi:hypothetical protein
MATVKDIIEEVLNELFKVDVPKADQEVLDQISFIVRELQGNGVSGKQYKDYTADELSRVAGSLAILKVSLGEIIAKAERTKDLTKRNANVRRATIRTEVIRQIDVIRKQMGRKATTDDIEAALDMQMYKYDSIIIFRKEHYIKCLNLWDSVNTLLFTISGRLNVLKSDYFTANLEGNNLEFDLKDIVRVTPEVENKIDEEAEKTSAQDKKEGDTTLEF